MDTDTPTRYVGGYVDQSDRLHLLYRNDEAALCEHVIRARWSTYFSLDALGASHRDEIERSPHVVRSTPEGNWLRVDWKNRDVRRAILCVEDAKGRPLQNWFRTRGITPHEVDVHPIRRFFVDTDSQVETNPRVVFIDIETDSRLPFVEKHKMRVLCVGVVAGCDIPEKGWSKGHKERLVLEADTDEAEAELLEALFDLLDPFDVVAAWYGDGFDFEVIRARARTHKLNVNFQRWRFLDHLEVFKGLNSHVAESGEEKQSMALNNVAHALLGEGKHDFDASKAWDAWEAGGAKRKELVDYCVQDTELLLKIEERTGYIALFATICGACKLFVETYSLKSTVQMDGFMLRLGKERGFHFPSRFGDPPVDKYEGAFVMHPDVTGVQHDVHVADFSSLYPSIIISWNMSPDTVDRTVPVNGPIPPNRCRAPNTGIGFRTDVEGMLPAALKTLIAMRKKWNDLKASLPPGTSDWVDADRWSMAYKVLANSFYGVLGSIFSRYYDRGIAESVTTTGAWLIKGTIREALRWVPSFETIYGDTDSIFVARDGDGSDIGSVGYQGFLDFTAHCNANLYPEMLKRQGCVTNRISLAYEKAFKRLVLLSAKKYVGVYAHYKGKPATADSKPEVKGLEYKRGDTVRLARQMQGEVIDLFVGGCETPTEYESIVKRWKHRVLYEPFELADVVLSQSLSKPIGEYVAKTPPAHVRVAMLLKERGEDVSVGVRIEYFIANAEPGRTGGAEVLPAKDWTGECDRFALWEKRVYPATQRVLDSAFPDYDWKQHLKVRPRKRRGKGASGEGTLNLPLESSRPNEDGPMALPPPPTTPNPASGRPAPLRRPTVAPGFKPLGELERKLPATRVAVTLDARGRPDVDRATLRFIHQLRALLDTMESGYTPVHLTLVLDDGDVELAVERKVQLTRRTMRQFQALVVKHARVKCKAELITA